LNVAADWFLRLVSRRFWLATAYQHVEKPPSDAVQEPLVMMRRTPSLFVTQPLMTPPSSDSAKTKPTVNAITPTIATERAPAFVMTISTSSSPRASLHPLMDPAFHSKEPVRRRAGCEAEWPINPADYIERRSGRQDRRTHSRTDRRRGRN
jgi:hypothetical protein